MQQYFINETFEIGKTYALDEKQSHHLLHVLKAKESLTIKVVDNQQNYDIGYFKIENDRALFTIEHLYNGQQGNKRILLMALIKKDKWDYCLMKASELGVTDIYPLYTSRCVIKPKDQENKLKRYQKIVENAAAQCKRNDIPLVHDVITLKTIPEFSSMTKILPYEKEDSCYIGEVDLSNDCVFAIGPEGGFTEDEVNQFVQKGFQCVTLGKRILRAETAAFYTLVAIDMTRQGEK